MLHKGTHANQNVRRLTRQAKQLKPTPIWFEVRTPRAYQSRRPVASRIIVEDEQGTRIAKKTVSDITVNELRKILPMGVSKVMPVYFRFIKSINLKLYHVYACYNPKLCYPLFYTHDISELGELHKLKKRKNNES